jgi:hypothetical protein
MPPFTINGTLNTTGGAPVAGATITLQNSTNNVNWNNVTTNVTDANGNYQFSNNESAASTYYYRTAYDGNATYTNSTSNVVSVQVNTISTQLSSASNLTSVAVNQNFTINGTLNTTAGTAIAGATITLQNSTNNIAWNNVWTNVTNANGTYQFNGNESAAGTYYYRTTYAGNATYTNATSKVVSVNVTTPPPIPTTLTIKAPSSASTNQNFTINGTLDASTGGIANAIITLRRSTDNVTFTNVSTNVTNTTGGYAFSKNESAAGTYYYRTTYAGNATYANATSNVVKVSVTAPATAGNLLLNTHLVSTTTGSPPKMVTTYTFSGQLMTTSWTPITNAAITLQSSADTVHWSAFASPVKTNAQGAYTFKGTLKPGSYYFRTFFAGTSSTGPTASKTVKIVISSNGSSSVSTVVA